MKYFATVVVARLRALLLMFLLIAMAICCVNLFLQNSKRKFWMAKCDKMAYMQFDKIVSNRKLFQYQVMSPDLVIGAVEEYGASDSCIVLGYRLSPEPGRLTLLDDGNAVVAIFQGGKLEPIRVKNEFEEIGR